MDKFDDSTTDTGARESGAGICGEIDGSELIATTHWEAKSFASHAGFDPAYERAMTALRRWVESMEATLNQPRVTWPREVRDARPRR